MGSVKLSMETPAGGRSKRVILKFAFPLLQPEKHPPFFSPLHDPKARTMTDKPKRNNALIFMIHPKYKRSVPWREQRWTTSTKCHAFYRGCWRFGSIGVIVKSNRYSAEEEHRRSSPQSCSPQSWRDDSWKISTNEARRKSALGGARRDGLQGCPLLVQEASAAQRGVNCQYLQ